ncbi:DNA-directed RNA polymerase 2 [Capsaspora owczarzaki ATCC 30864]|uniref:DNA-directed RNA polymerase 2 n=1 Tax=Capsaspora owczarzaki (strain ATCC 30864) TaxID=595528 RepID=A0A0D2WNW1_CAPO3|nr:DNA-directed RNA polymerase 2 [Capsaspora owczarzaki ATCC 30864]KJE92163.1 DNA-directed RNA polymerase 2 [Capsaspora owczarzaki ATCC 30864]|eukprot:XP_004364021.1 DNA-directed RNA polymerase 2 [Capsaspora owczarzaki ATCC 30864]
MDSAEQQHLQRMYRIYQTVMQMCHDRHYIVTADELEQNLETFRAKVCTGNDLTPVRERMLCNFAYKDDPTKSILVMFATEVKVGVAPIRQMIEQMSTQSIQRGIIVVQDCLTSFARSTLAEAMPQFIIEEFKEAELLVNITRHTLVPKHEVLSDDDKIALLKQYKLKEAQLPRIHSTDPVARYLGLRRGQVVRITRQSETAGRYITYRLVL